MSGAEPSRYGRTPEGFSPLPSYAATARPPVGYPGPPPAPDPSAALRTNTMAILALVFAFVFAPLAIVFGVVGRRQIDRTGEQGRGLATAGLVLGLVFTALSVLYVVLVVAVLTSMPALR